MALAVQALLAEIVQMFTPMLAYGLAYGGLSPSSSAHYFTTAQSYEHNWTKLCLLMDSVCLVVNNWNVQVTKGLKSDFVKCVLHVRYGGLLHNRNISRTLPPTMRRKLGGLRSEVPKYAGSGLH